MARGPRPFTVVQPGAPSWIADLRRDRGRVIPDLANVLIALRNNPAFNAAMGFNEMRQRSVAMTEWPAAPGAHPIAACPHDIGDDDVSRLQEFFQHHSLPRIGAEIVRAAAEVFARERMFHPIRDWLNAIEWDGEPRMAAWLHQCLGCPDDEYHRQIGSMFLVAMVARIFRPGCKCDYMIVLEGPQGEEKSKFCRALAGDGYFSDSLPKIEGDQVRLSMHMRGYWLIEVAELSAMIRADPEGVKHFISRQSEQYTPKYGRSEVDEPRQNVLIGTTNDDEYIRDVTGGRRYWPVVVAQVRLDRLLAMREQLFAEAAHAYRMGQQWWPDREFEKTVIMPVQDDRQWEDAWTEQVGKIIENRTQITIAELAEILGVEMPKLDRLTQKRLADILRKPYGWSKYRTHGGAKAWRKS